jgi:hypothetical protein
MDVKRYWIATLALFAFFFIYEGYVHGHLLMPYYEETAPTWRPFSQMQSNILLTALYHFILAAWTAFFFVRVFPFGGVKDGLKFGLYLGVFAGLMSASWYLWLPIPFSLAWAWFLASVIQGLIGGFILGVAYKNKEFYTN